MKELPNQRLEGNLQNKKGNETKVKLLVEPKPNQSQTKASNFQTVL